MRTFGGFRYGDRFFYGEIRGDEVHVLRNPFWIDIEPTGEVVRLTNVIVDLPVSPSKLIAVGLNYADHIAEMKRTTLGTPLIWFKSPGSLLPHDGKIEIAFPEHQTDFEAELAVVIGKETKKIAEEAALDSVFGYMILHDVSARDIQFKDKQFTRSKGFDTFAPCGPWITTKEEVGDPQNLKIVTKVNSEVRQSSSSSNMVIPIRRIISALSRTMTLEPGDIISTGTPAGVAMSMKEPKYLKDGDVVEITIEKLGTIRNRIVFQ